MAATSSKRGKLWAMFSTFHEGRVLQDNAGRTGVVVCGRHRNYDNCNETLPTKFLVKWDDKELSEEEDAVKVMACMLDRFASDAPNCAWVRPEFLAAQRANWHNPSEADLEWARGLKATVPLPFAPEGGGAKVQLVAQAAFDAKAAAKGPAPAVKTPGKGAAARKGAAAKGKAGAAGVAGAPAVVGGVAKPVGGRAAGGKGKGDAAKRDAGGAGGSGGGGAGKAKAKAAAGRQGRATTSAVMAAAVAAAAVGAAALAEAEADGDEEDAEGEEEEEVVVFELSGGDGDDPGGVGGPAAGSSGGPFGGSRPAILFSGF
ncbi:hypothetical protein FOA52_009554 [Chlamydomonas sp. UWO 241]|nr:hypothetical protein FOA52_009554 [Chlamydomonas sp. UWO 241]